MGKVCATLETLVSKPLVSKPLVSKPNASIFTTAMTLVLLRTCAPNVHHSYIIVGIRHCRYSLVYTSGCLYRSNQQSE